MELFTPEELFKNYPFIAHEMRWSKQDIQVFLAGHLLQGEFTSEDQSEFVIAKDSFERLIQYHRDVATNQKAINQNSGE